MQGEAMGRRSKLPAMDVVGELQDAPWPSCAGTGTCPTDKRTAEHRYRQ